MKTNTSTKGFCSYKKYYPQPRDNKPNQIIGVIRIIITEEFLQLVFGTLQKENREVLE